MRQIPTRLLPDDLSYKAPVADSDYDGEYGEPCEVRHVRFVPESELSPNAYSLQDGSKGLVFIDGQNSEGGCEVPAGALVTIRGQEMAVVRSTAYEDFDGHLHHWELEVR